MSKNRIGIVRVSMGLLDGWMHLPTGTHIKDVRRLPDSPFGEFEVLIEGPAVPETDLIEPTPHMLCTVTVMEPKVEFTIFSPRPARADFTVATPQTAKGAE